MSSRQRVAQSFQPLETLRPFLRSSLMLLQTLRTLPQGRTAEFKRQTLRYWLTASLNPKSKI